MNEVDNFLQFDYFSDTMTVNLIMASCKVLGKHMLQKKQSSVLFPIIALFINFKPFSSTFQGILQKQTIQQII
jgi:hypothetical protein